MSVAIRDGSLLQVRLLTPASFGAGEGGAAIDRPLVRDPWDGLPYIPQGSLKGVLAGTAFGNLGGRRHQDRVRLHGRPTDDEDTTSWGAGELTLGDGLPLAFPLPLQGGAPAMVFPARTLHRLRRLGQTDAPLPVSTDDSLACSGNVSNAQVSDVRVEPGPDLGAELARLSGSVLVDRWLVAPPAAALVLWDRSVEVRAATALGPGKRATDMTQRRAELTPSGSIFVCVVTVRPSDTIDLGDVELVQLGGLEGSGCGFAAISVARPASPGAAPGNVEVATEAIPGSDDEAQIMTSAYAEVRALVNGQDPKVAAIARAVLRQLGPRLRTMGLARSLAFALAKAAPGKPANARRVAYRWVLARLVAAEGPEAVGDVASMLSGDRPPPLELETRLRWIRRFAEGLIHSEAEP